MLINNNSSSFRAYETLSDETKKDMYDATGMSAHEQEQAEAQGFSGFNPFTAAFWNSFTGGS